MSIKLPKKKSAKSTNQANQRFRQLCYEKNNHYNYFAVYFYFCFAQNSITGTFSGLANQQIKLVGFKGFDTYAIDSVQANEEGQVQLSFGTEDFGMGYILSKDSTSFILVLESNQITLQGNSFEKPESIKILKGNENQLFEQYASEHPRREQTLSAWDYLTKIYCFLSPVRV